MGHTAGVAGLEPANAGVKVPCLTTWRHPIAGCPPHDAADHFGFYPFFFSQAFTPTQEEKRGRIVGLEPTTSRATIWRSTTELYPPHCPFLPCSSLRPARCSPDISARLEGFEPPTHGLEGRCSIRLSYRRRPETRQSIPQDFLLTGIDYIKGCCLCQHLF